MDDVVARHRCRRGAERRWVGLEPLEPRMLLSAAPSPFEQEMLWLINDMRTDPADHLDHFITGYGTPASSSDGEIQGALTYFNVVGATLQSDWSALTDTAPVAWSPLLDDAAEFHSQNMIDEDAQKHEFPEGPTIVQRIEATGYQWGAIAENIYAYSESALYGHAGFVVDWGNDIDGMQDPPGHRNNIMNPVYVHVGIASISEDNEDTDVGPYVVTQDFAKLRSDHDPYLVGTIWADANADGKFDGGEGFGGVNVTAVGAETYSTTTWGAGGYQMQLPAGTYEVSIAGGTFAGTDLGQVTIADENVMLDGNPQGNGVVGRRLFYNNSVWDGEDPTANQGDDAAIAWDKSPLLPGETAGPTNYTGHGQGINGLMVDVYDSANVPVLADFGFRTGADPDPNNWSAAPTPAFTVRPGAGSAGSDRATFIWPDGAITDKWIEVTVLSDAGGGGLGLAGNDVFYFASAVGDTDGDGQVGSSDSEALAGEFGRKGGISTLGSDFNVDGGVDLDDFAIMRGAYGSSVLAPTIPAAAPEAPPASPAIAIQAADEAIAAGAAPVVPVVSQSLDGSDADDDSIATAASAPAIDLLAESPSATSHIPEPQPISVGSSAATLYRAATGEYDLRSLGDDLPAGESDDLLADILAESALAAPL